MRINGTFSYATQDSVEVDTTTGFIKRNVEAELMPGCECQIDKQIPAKRTIGTDGQETTYNYDVFIPKYFKGELSVGCKMRIESGGLVDEFEILGIDDLNGKYIEVWG